MTIDRALVGFIVATWALAALGFVLAFTVSPGAINMGVGCGIAALFMTIAVAVSRLP